MHTLLKLTKTMVWINQVNGRSYWVLTRAEPLPIASSIWGRKLINGLESQLIGSAV